MQQHEQLSEFQIMWCAIMFTALSVLYMDIFKWRPDQPEICHRATYHSN